MAEQHFDIEIMPFEDSNGGYGFVVPFVVEEVFGSKGLVKVKGTIDGYAYRSSVFPVGDGTHYMVVNKEVRGAIDKMQGGLVSMTMEVDTDARTVTMPPDLQILLDQNDTARAFFEKLAYSHQKEYVDWIEEAKKPETRVRRLEQTIQMLEQGKKNK